MRPQRYQESREQPARFAAAVGVNQQSFGSIFLRVLFVGFSIVAPFDFDE